ncbi:MAG: hypothetical protein A2017_19695 [Lentisphaerae bacterium GWF2_44_16]|nr:MAG: hypothetical protein A2017_19695 [Lentisphaerae bacterium GWF2_44_16]
MDETKFAPSEKVSPEEIEKLRIRFQERNPFWNAFDVIPDIILVLNRTRQIIYANKAFLKFLDISSADKIYGKRPGEVLLCANSSEDGTECGAAESCSLCGGMEAIMNGLSGINDVREYRIYRKGNLGALDFRVWTYPMKIEGDNENYVIAAIADISNEKRRKILERIFFHDIMNTAGGISGMISLIRGKLPKEFHTFIDAMKIASNSLLNEINEQKQLVAAENNELKPAYNPLNSLDILNEVMKIYKGHEVAREKNIEVVPDAPGIFFKSDLAILRRVVGNMTKNALEGSKRGGIVTLNCKLIDNGKRIQFSVHNNGFIPRKVQLQIFQRSFSTKGLDRGIGTYSIKFLSEKYLKGNVYFESSEEKGTTFYAEYPLEF